MHHLYISVNTDTLLLEHLLNNFYEHFVYELVSAFEYVHAFEYDSVYYMRYCFIACDPDEIGITGT